MITKFKLYEEKYSGGIIHKCTTPIPQYQIGEYVRFYSRPSDKSLYKIIDIDKDQLNYQPYTLIKIDDKNLVPTYYHANYVHIYLVPDYVIDSEKYNL